MSEDTTDVVDLPILRIRVSTNSCCVEILLPAFISFEISAFCFLIQRIKKAPFGVVAFTRNKAQGLYPLRFLFNFLFFNT